jgi:hypothetical protein
MRMSRPRRWLLGCLGLAVLAVGGVLVWLLSPQGIRIVLTPAQLQITCDHFFPVSKRYLDLIDLTYHDPAIAISAGDDRVHLVVPLSVAIAGHALQGSVRGSACLRYEAQSGELFLDRLRVEEVTIDQVSSALLARMLPLASQLLAEHLEAHPIYRLQGSLGRDLEHLVIRRLQVLHGDLVLTLGR